MEEISFCIYPIGSKIMFIWQVFLIIARANLIVLGMLSMVTYPCSGFLNLELGKHLLPKISLSPIVSLTSIELPVNDTIE